MLSAGCELPITVFDDEMYPCLKKDRDVVMLANPIRLRRGLVVLVILPDGQVALSRIVRKNDTYLVLRGDHALAPKRTCGIDSVIAVAMIGLDDVGNSISLHRRLLGIVFRPIVRIYYRFVKHTKTL